MPKVTQEYILNKKKRIVDAAYKMCIQKTVSTVTMQDIINETGLSQGGIYRFYKDIDEILADMIDRIRKESHFQENLDTILSQARDVPFQDTVYAVFDLLGKSMEAELLSIEKIDFELSVLAMNSPQRVDNILSKTKIHGNKEYLSIRTAELFNQALEEGKIHVRIPIPELFAYITSIYSGIQMTCIVNTCYHSLSIEEKKLWGPTVQMQLLAKTVLQFIE